MYASDFYSVVLWSGYYIDQGGCLTPKSELAGKFSRRTAMRLAEGIGDMVLHADIAHVEPISDAVVMYW